MRSGSMTAVFDHGLPVRLEHGNLGCDTLILAPGLLGEVVRYEDVHRPQLRSAAAPIPINPWRLCKRLTHRLRELSRGTRLLANLPVGQMVRIARKPAHHPQNRIQPLPLPSL